MRRAAGARLALAGATALGLVVAVGLWWPRPAAIGADVPLPEASAGDDGRLVIAVLGTSLTAGYDWPERLGTRLSGCLEKPVEVVPVARGGATSRWGARQLADVAASKPDLVLVEFSINDADLRRGVSLQESARLHRRILNGLAERAPDAGVVLMSMSPAWGSKRLLRPRLARYYALYPELAAEEAAGFVDLYREWMAYPRAGAAFPDGVHPMPAAAREVILPALIQYLLAALSPATGTGPKAGCPALPRG